MRTLSLPHLPNIRLREKVALRAVLLLTLVLLLLQKVELRVLHLRLALLLRVTERREEKDRARAQLAKVLRAQEVRRRLHREL